MSSPYQGRESRSFWRTGVAGQDPRTVTELYRPKFKLAPEALVATAGSCFAQHIAGRLRAHGIQVLDAEPPPPGLSAAQAKAYGYLLYSARYANIYTCRQLLQLAREAHGLWTPADAVWQKDGRYVDALRPSVEPAGLDSAEEVQAHRAEHLGHVRQVLSQADVLVFTLGLTEAWVHRSSGTVYPTAPGTLAGEFDPERHAFVNFGVSEVLADFLALRSLLLQHRPGLRFLLTVSPVPLTATATDDHVLVATTHSKSVLRAVAGELAATLPDVDYFPSYEIIASPFSRGRFYEDNLRSVTSEGVDAVMRVFSEAHGLQLPAEPSAEGRRAEAKARPEAPNPNQGWSSGQRPGRSGRRGQRRRDGDAVCEEALLEAFRP